MSVSDNSCNYIAKTVKDAIGDGANPVTLERHEQLFVSLVERRASRGNQRRFMYIGAASLAAAAAAVLLLLAPISSPDALSFTVGNNQQSGDPGDWIETSPKESTHIQFHQGSHFQVGKNSAARIVESNEEAVTIELSKGEIHAVVKGNNKTIWKMNAGPFAVTVLGTAFHVDWDAKQSQLDVKVTKGLVLVQGGGLNIHGIRLAAGQVLLANGRSGEVSVDSVAKQTLSKAQRDPAKPISDEPPIPNPNGDRPVKKPADPNTTTTPVKRAQSPLWLVHYNNAAYPDAIESAKQQGLLRIQTTTSLNNLWKLADAARNSGQASISNETLVALRKRFPSSPKAKLAAFIIGRSAMDRSNSPSIAIQWFNTYLKESPQGSMGEEAYGRLMNLYKKIGNSTQASQTATRYLAKYPNGLYANRARQVLR